MNGYGMSPYRKMWYLLYPILVYAGIFYVVESLGSILAFAAAVVAVKQAGGSLTYNSILEQVNVLVYGYSYELNTLAAIFSIPVELLFLRMDRKAKKGQMPVYDRVPLPYYAVALVLGAASCLALNNMMNLSGLFETYSESMEEVASQLYRGQLLVEIIGTALIVPLMEEILFRGVLQNRIREMTGTNMAIIGSALLFAGYHGNMLQIIYTTILGLILGYVYEKYRNLAAPVLVHVGANMVSVIGSETGCLDFMYQSDTMIMIYTAVWCAVIFVCIYLVHDHVNPAELHRSEEERRDEA